MSLVINIKMILSSLDGALGKDGNEGSSDKLITSP